MTYVDSCIPMYLVGKPHPNKTHVIDQLTRLTLSGEKFVASVEVLQEIIYRYRALADALTLNQAYLAAEKMVETFEPLFKVDCDLAKELVLVFPKLSSRDCLHVSVMRRLGCEKIWTFDRGFDSVKEIVRLE